MPAGRKPVPRALKVLRGNPGRRPLPKPVAIATGIPDVPPFLNAAARSEWNRVTAELGATVLSPADRATLAAYCVAWATFVEAEAKIAELGLIVLSVKEQTPMYNLYLPIRNKAMEQIHRFGAELGLSPSSRSRLKLTGEPSAEDPFDAFRRRKRPTTTA